MPILLALAALLLLTTYAPPSLYRAPERPSRTTIRFAPIALDAEAPDRRRLGGLVYRGGWAITSNDPRFGGLSAMHVDEEAVTALSDAGSLIRFTLPGEKPASVTIRPLRDGPGKRRRKFDRDTEAMVMSGPFAWVAFEGRNVIWRYRRRDWRGVAAAKPPGMDWPTNEGAEAMLRLGNGSFLVFSEEKRRPDGSTAVLLFEGDPALSGTEAVALGYRAPPGYRITDATLLPDGRLLFLNRRFSLIDGITAKLTVADPPRLAAGTVIEGVELAHFEAPVVADNMEALSVTQEDGRTIVWIASDDNFSALQQTLLLKFALAGEAG